MALICKMMRMIKNGTKSQESSRQPKLARRLSPLISAGIYQIRLSSGKHEALSWVLFHPQKSVKTYFVTTDAEVALRIIPLNTFNCIQIFLIRNFTEMTEIQIEISCKQPRLCYLVLKLNSCQLLQNQYKFSMNSI